MDRQRLDRCGFTDRLGQIQQNPTVVPQPKATVTIVTVQAAPPTSAEKRMLSLVNNLNENNSRVMSTLKRKKNRKSKKSSTTTTLSSLNTKQAKYNHALVGEF